MIIMYWEKLRAVPGRRALAASEGQGKRRADEWGRTARVSGAARRRLPFRTAARVHSLASAASRHRGDAVERRTCLARYRLPRGSPDPGTPWGELAPRPAGLPTR